MVREVIILIFMYQFLTFQVCGFSDLTGSLFNFFRALGILPDCICMFVIFSDTIWPAIRHNVVGISFSVPLDGSYMITLLPPLTIWSITITFLFSIIMSLMYDCESAVYDLNILSCPIVLSSWKSPLMTHFPFSICSWRYCSLVIWMLHLCLVFYIINLSIFITLTMYDLPLWSRL